MVGHMGGCSCGRAFPEVRVGHSGAGSWVDCVKDSRDGRPGSAEARSQGERARGREGQAEVGVEKLASSVRGHLCYTEGTDGVSPIKGNVYRAPIGTPLPIHGNPEPSAGTVTSSCVLVAQGCPLPQPLMRWVKCDNGAQARRFRWTGSVLWL